MKYIIFDEVFPVVFGGHYSHNQITSGGKPTSAGKFWIDTKGNVSVWGESISLGLKSNLDDAWLIEKILKND